MRNHLAREGITDPRVRVRRRAQDRRAGDLADLPRRRVRARRHPRQRRGRRGRHPQPADDAVDPAADRGPEPAGAGRGARRGVHVAAGLRRAQRAPGAGRAVDVHEPAQLRGRDDPPARPEARRRPAAVAVDLRRRRDRGDHVRRPLGRARMAARAPLPGPPRRQEARDRGRGDRAVPGLGGAPRVARFRDRRGRGQGQPGRAPAPAGLGRPRAAVGDRVEVPADHRGHAAEPDRLGPGQVRRPAPGGDARAGARRAASP